MKKWSAQKGRNDRFERSNACRQQSWEEPRSPDIRFPITFRFSRGGSSYHHSWPNCKHHLALLYSCRKQEEFEKFSKLYFPMQFNIKIQMHLTSQRNSHFVLCPNYSLLTKRTLKIFTNLYVQPPIQK